jgi:hypothetical protein
MSSERRWLAAMIAGRQLPPTADPDEQIDTLLADAIDEGVVALVHARMSSHPDVSAALRDTFAAAARDAALPSLMREAECRRILAVLQDADIPVLLLKGSALGWWLYPAPYLRECVDIDVLFSTRAHAQAAAKLLAGSGYVLHHIPGDLWSELMCRRRVGLTHVDLDMHWRLTNAPLFASLFDFETLYTTSIPLTRLASCARGLDPVHAFLHACIHRVVNLHIGLGDRLKWLYDLHLLARHLQEPDWLALQQACRIHGLSGICAAGIEAAADLFGNAVPGDVLQSLKRAAASEPLDVARLDDWKYMQARNLAALPSLRLRIRWLRQRVFPPIGYLRALYGADRNLASLLIQRVRNAIRRLRF